MPDADDVDDACASCDGPVTWVDEAWVCDTGCTYCAECAEAAGSCVTCSAPLTPVRRTRPVRR